MRPLVSITLAAYNVKEFIEERDLRVYFAFDFSASGSFGNLVEKRKKAIELTATLMFSALRNNDNVGLFIFTDKVETFIPARKGKKHVLKLLSQLIRHEAKSPKTDLQESFSFIAKVLKKRSVLFLISDFYAEDYMQPIRILRKKHDVISIKIEDVRERNIPDIGLIELEDEETGEQLLVDTSDKEFQDNYASLIKKQDEELNQMFKKLKIDSINLVTDQAYQIPLKKFFRMRQKKVIF